EQPRHFEHDRILTHGRRNATPQSGTVTRQQHLDARHSVFRSLGSAHHTRDGQDPGGQSPECLVDVRSLTPHGVPSIVTWNAPSTRSMGLAIVDDELPAKSRPTAKFPSWATITNP